MNYKIRIYGDNILECERALDLIQKGIELSERRTEKAFIRGNLFVPTFTLKADNSYEVTLFPGLKDGRWNVNIYDELVTGNGGSLSEGADALITVERPHDGKILEIPCIAIEFSSALPAGNNAWQRSGRALSFSQSGIPYIYATEIGGNELEADGNVKATRWPASALILSYILNSARKSVTNLIHYKLSPVSTKELKATYNFLQNDTTLEEITYKAIVSENMLNSQNENAILNIDKSVYHMIAKTEEDYNLINGNYDPESAISGIKKQKLKWKKKVSIPTSGSFQKLKKLLSKYCYSPYSKDGLPFAVLPQEHKAAFISELKTIYINKQISDLETRLLASNNDVVFALINGFKPGGEDSRPDRGVVPFIRMLLGDDIPIITVLFGPVPEYHIEKFKKQKYDELAKGNGLFSAILSASEYIVIDTVKHGNNKAYFFTNPIRSRSSFNPHTLNYLNTKVSELPSKIGENDVDTLIHMFFKHGLNDVFESFSNPPGGDWSGISILIGNYEYRWISLPRAPKNVKRPDHIFQIDDRTLLSIESKDYYTTLMRTEKDVGPHMISYLEDLLFPRPINAVRLCGQKYFDHYNESISLDLFEQLTAATFISKTDEDISYDSLSNLMSVTNTDMVFGIKVMNITDVEIHYLTYNQKISNLFEDGNNKVIQGFDVVKIINKRQ